MEIGITKMQILIEKINFNYENEYKKKKTILWLKTQNDKYPVHFIGN
jgi:hypothetical protein